MRMTRMKEEEKEREDGGGGDTRREYRNVKQHKVEKDDGDNKGGG